MFNEKASSSDKAAASVDMGGEFKSGARGGGVFNVKCFDKDGNLKWEENAHNLVVNEGLQLMNDEFFTGSSYTAAWYLGLVTGPGSGNTYAAGDTMASHAGWTEDEDYSELVRQTATFGSSTLADPSVIDNSGAVAVFSIDATTTIAGAFLSSDDTKGGTTGILFSVSNFTSPGDRAVVSGDTLNVTYTFSLDAA
jgi:hypothetical protein